MSNALRFDALLTRDLARELAQRLAGARLDAVLLDRERLRVALLVRPLHRAAAGSPSLLWQLHPLSGHVTPTTVAAATGARVPLAVSVIVDVTAPADERILTFELDAGEAATGAPRRIIIELITNQWNALAVSADDRIVAVLRERQTRERTLRVGAPYVAPAATGRAWSDERPDATEWARVLRSAPAGERLRALLRAAAWTSPLNAAAILGRADFDDSDAAMERARLRYLDVVHDAAREPVLLGGAGGAQPYSVRLNADDVAQPTLLDAFAAAAATASALPLPTDLIEQARTAVARRIEHVETRLARLEHERAGAAQEAGTLRAQADLLLSRLQDVQRGAAEVVLDDWSGASVRITLDPTLAPAENARRLYDTARRRSRAAERVPDLLTAGRAELDRLHALAERIRDGTASDAELKRIAARRSTRAPGSDVATVLPYRTYRTSGGLEVRVGRGARTNDDLTFRHARPNDVWLHARDVAGAHVILRWGRVNENPPARDIAEAAILAALHSRARTSGTVAVDWTRRKHVRKPRKAGPGLVIPERVKTVFVEPDATLVQRLRCEPGDAFE